MEEKTPEAAAQRARQRAAIALAKFSTKEESKPVFSSEEVLSALNDNEIGDARLLIKAMHRRFVYDASRKIWFNLVPRRFTWNSTPEIEAL